MTDLEIEKLAEAIARRLPTLVKINEELHDEIIDVVNEAVKRAVRLGLSRVQHALTDLAEDL